MAGNPFPRLLSSGAVLVALGWFAGCGQDPEAGDRFVSSGEAGCDVEATPDASPAKIVGSLESGMTACFREGTHSSTETIELSAPGVTLTSFPGERATLQGRLWLTREADDATIRDLTLDGSSGDGPSPTVNADRASFRNNEITNAHTDICFVLGDDVYGEADGTQIERNRIHDCGELPATNHHHGIYVAHATDTVIRDNVIYGNADRGIQLYPDADRSLITRNVIDGNGQGLIISGNDRRSSDDNVIENNLITNSTIRYNVESSWPGPVGSGNVVRRNCVYGGARDNGDGGIERPPDGFEAVENLVSDPLYIDREAGDYGLEEDSPCAALAG